MKAGDPWLQAEGRMVVKLTLALCLMAVTILLSGVHFLLAARALPADLARRPEAPT